MSMLMALRRGSMITAIRPSLPVHVPPMTGGCKGMNNIGNNWQNQLHSRYMSRGSTSASKTESVGVSASRIRRKGTSGGKNPKQRTFVQCKMFNRRSKASKPATFKAVNKLTRANAATETLKSSKGLSTSSIAMRFSNENSYLNWARNGVLSSSVGVAMYAQEHHRGAQLSGAGLLLLGFGYIGVGTMKYIYYIIRFRHLMELTWGSVIGTVSHASVALVIWLTATASFLESVPLELDAVLLTEPIVDYLPFRIRQGLIETYSLYLDDLEQKGEEERVLRAIRNGQREELLIPQSELSQDN